MDENAVEALARRVAIVEARQVVQAELDRRDADNREQSQKTWKAISDLQTITTRMETVVDYQEGRQKEAEASQKQTDQTLVELRLEQAREAGKMGAIAGITSSVIVSVIIQLALAAMP